MSKRIKLAEIVKSCEARFNRGAAADWKHSDFTDLNREIFKDTGVNISANTLKRIFGKISVENEYAPQHATLDALIKYSGYVESENETVATEEPVLRKTIVQSLSAKWWILLSVAVLAAAIFLGWNFFHSKMNDKGSVTLKKTEGLLPLTAFFELQLPSGNDSLFMDFGDKSAFVYIKQDEKTIAHNYLFPGVFEAKLRTRQNTIASVPLTVQSDKWIGLGFRRQAEIPEKYYEFPAVKTGADSVFHISNVQLKEKGLDTIGLFFTRLCNYTPVETTSEDFIFEASFKSAFDEKGIYCKGTQFQISGINGCIRFKLASEGCSYRVINIISEQLMEGSKTNLSQFTANLAQWNKVKVINKNKQVILLLNDKEIFKGAYQKALGDMKGVFIEFEGSGFVKNCSLKTIDGKMLYWF